MRHVEPWARLRQAMAVTVLAVALVLGGCASHNLRVPQPVVGETLHQARTSAIGWGVSEDYAIADKCADTNRIAEVQVRTSFWQALGTVLTLGLWQPADIRYRCGKRDTGIGEIPQ
jgi:hypothetical protein